MALSVGLLNGFKRPPAFPAEPLSAALAAALVGRPGERTGGVGGNNAASLVVFLPREESKARSALL